jgi:hypothetical protein
MKPSQLPGFRVWHQMTRINKKSFFVREISALQRSGTRMGLRSTGPGFGGQVQTSQPCDLSRRGQPWPVASLNQLGIRRRLESSSGEGGSEQPLLGGAQGAAMTAVNNRSLLLSGAARVGGVSAVRIASVPLVVLKVPAAALAIAVVSRSNPSSSQLWPSHIASTP